ncbi:unnamed protein product [Xylocopa violacea]|uniref:Uncharacterized protein n=1 Tax=Xylocopa violacea TaxID=135666 RepID=A0ABP1NNM9_XYLVO
MLSCSLNSCLDYKHVELKGKTWVLDVTKAGDRIRARLASSCAIIVGFEEFWENSGHSVGRAALFCGSDNCLDHGHVESKGQTRVLDVTKAGDLIRASCLDYKHVELKGKTWVLDVTKAGDRIRARFASSCAIIVGFEEFWENSGHSVGRAALFCGSDNCLDHGHVESKGQTRVLDMTKAGDRIRARLA